MSDKPTKPQAIAKSVVELATADSILAAPFWIPKKAKAEFAQWKKDSERLAVL